MIQKSKTGLFRPVFFYLLLFVSFFSCSAFGGDLQPPSIAIIIDDLGKRLTTGKQVVNLPGPVACSFLPHERYTQVLARQAHKQHKEILLHQPMESVDRRAMDKGGILLDMTEKQLNGALRNNLAQIPYVQGINNHMGSLLTRHPGHMYWLMQELQRNGNLYFVDSRTTKATVAYSMAREFGIPSSKRNIFLDNVSNPQAVRKQFRALLRSARKNGTALALGHPYRSTLQVLQEELPVLKQQGIKLVSVSELIRMQQESKTWQAAASLSLSPKAVKSSKQ